MSETTYLRRRMTEEMRLAGHAPLTQATYLRCIQNLAEYFRRKPDLLSEEQIRQFFLHLLDKGISEGSFRTHRFACQFFYSRVLGRTIPALGRMQPRKSKKLPVILSEEEVAAIVNKVCYLPARVCMWTIYCCGLRRAEAVALTANDIDSKRMLVRVRSGKGSKDRYVPLCQSLLDLLRSYWAMQRPAEFLFPAAKNPHRPILPMTLGKTFHAALRQSGVRKEASLHTLRHSYATHLLEHKVNIRVIQEALGHTSLRTTSIYTHVTQNSQQQLRSALDAMLGHNTMKP